jgi:hypothetical protein
MISFSQSLCVPLENNSPFWAHLYFFRDRRSTIARSSIPHTNKHDRSWLSRSISIKSDGVKLVYSRFIFTALLLFNKNNRNNRKRFLHDDRAMVRQYNAYLKLDIERNIVKKNQWFHSHKACMSHWKTTAPFGLIYSSSETVARPLPDRRAKIEIYQYYQSSVH